MLQRFKADPKLGTAYRTMSELFPREYAAMLDELRAQPHPASESEAARAGYQAMRRQVIAKREQFMRAPDADIAQYLEALFLVGQTMQRTNPAGCVAAFTGRPEAFPRDYEALSAMSAVSAAYFRAAAAGQARPVIRMELAESDYSAWIEAMRAGGVEEATLELMFDRSLQAQATSDQLCGMRIAMMEGVTRLPLPIVGKFGAALMKPVQE
jgi:hypothetical protein